MRTRPGFAYLWEYRVEADQLTEFLRLYGPDGEWVRLFREAEGFVETHLLRDAGDRGRFVTIDYWVSRAARDR